MTLTAAAETEPTTPQGPRADIPYGNTRITLLGTAHVSAESAREVASLIDSGEFDAVAVELCPSRYSAMTEPDQLQQMDLFQVLRQGKAGLVAANLALGAFQQRVADEAGIDPGAEMATAIRQAEAHQTPVWLVDREVGTTLRRVYNNVPWWQRSSLIFSLFGSLLSREKVQPEEIERLKEGDVLTSTFESFAQDSRAIYEPLIAERDRYMAHRVMQEIDRNPVRRVLVVIGAGHLSGMTRALQEQSGPSDHAGVLDELSSIPARRRWWKIVPWLIAGVILTGFVIGFSRSSELGWSLILNWFLINGVLTAVGTALARAHPGTILTGFLAAPFTSLNPTIGAGFVASAAEIWLRKPRVSDFSRLRHDVARLRGWWQNRVARTLLVFFLASLGSAAGTWVGGFRVFELLAVG